MTIIPVKHRDGQQGRTTLVCQARQSSGGTRTFSTPQSGGHQGRLEVLCLDRLDGSVTPGIPFDVALEVVVLDVLDQDVPQVLCSARRLCVYVDVDSRASVGMSGGTWYRPGGGPLEPCKLCLGDFPSDHMTTVSQCGCVFCALCLKRYVTLLLSEGLGTGVSCPDTACPEQGLLLDTEIEVAVDPESMRRYRRLRFEREVLLDPCRTWCPAPPCQAVCQLKGAESAAPQTVGCPACGLEFCSACRAQRHLGRTCLDSSSRTFSSFLSGEKSSLLEAGVDGPVKPCPRCQVYIERDQGCAQMTCKNCKHSFCWYCLDSLDGDILLIHYDKGPCRNKLGHSRASVIWHRTQVVGMYAGCGVILLAASPFLLLATPLLFCCPWNCSRRADDPLPT
ncbi:unnamed protein product [Lota lota]